MFAVNCFVEMSRANTPPRVGTGCRFFRSEMSGSRSHIAGAPHPSDSAGRMKAAPSPSLQALIHPSTHPLICSLYLIEQLYARYTAVAEMTLDLLLGYAD